MYTVVIVDELGCLNLFLSLSLVRAHKTKFVLFLLNFSVAFGFGGVKEFDHHHFSCMRKLYSPFCVFKRE